MDLIFWFTGPALILFFISLMLTGWAFGFNRCRFSYPIWRKNSGRLLGAEIAIIIPFSALYYSPFNLSALGATLWRALFPSSYVFEALREMLFY